MLFTKRYARKKNIANGDNVKHISDIIKSRAVPRKAYDSGLLGAEHQDKRTNGAKREKVPSFWCCGNLKKK